MGQNTCQQNEIATSEYFSEGFIKADNVIELLARSQNSLASSIRAMPHFPWQILSTDVVMPEQIRKIFQLVRVRHLRLVTIYLTSLQHPDGLIKYHDGDLLLKVSPDLLALGAKESFALETSNYHRDALFMSLGTIFNTMWRGNEKLSEPHVSLFASLLLAQSFGYFCGPDKKLFSPVNVNPKLSDLRPDAVMGLFTVKKVGSDSYVESLLPNMDDLCTCLELLLDFGVCLGTNEVLLPTVVAEFTVSDDAQDM